ncbi:MAG: class I SAM-dependent methyltransferase [Magnetococcales bacterium]|nr:class I SAM-dependent methyltransferase [Magnetococcales bacterium]
MMKSADESQRLDCERDFHDRWAEQIDPAQVPVLETFSLSTPPEPKWLAEKMGDLRGKKILELGSGGGEGAVYFALQGADVIATDLSPGMLEVVHKVAQHHGVEVATQVSSAEDLSQFAEEQFDVVYAANLLHHVDIERCLDEVRRVLKPNGVAAFWDPVAHNPAINVYRRMAEAVRTEDEHPIRRSQMVWFRQRFSHVESRFFWLTTLIVFLKYYLVDRIHPSSDRYWKRILSHEEEIRWFYRPLAWLDRIILRLLPILGWWCWNIAIFCRK